MPVYDKPYGGDGWDDYDTPIKKAAYIGKYYVPDMPRPRHSDDPNARERQQQESPETKPKRKRTPRPADH